MPNRHNSGAAISDIPTMPWFRALLVSSFVLAAPAAWAADVSYPVGSRLGLTPPTGMQTSPGLQGFADPKTEAAILMVPLPKQAVAELDKVMTPDALKKEGITQTKRERLTVPFGKGFLILGKQQAQGLSLRKWLLVVEGDDLGALITVQIPDKAVSSYPDAAIRAALQTLTSRASVPDAEQLSLLPFVPNNLAEFRVAAVVPNRALLLSDVPNSEATAAEAPHIVVTLGANAPQQSDERENFARRAFDTVSNLRDIKIVSSEALRISGQPGHQILAEAKDAQTGADLKVVQWIRFGGNAHIQMVGTSRADAWEKAFPRFRAVRDGLDLR